MQEGYRGPRGPERRRRTSLMRNQTSVKWHEIINEEQTTQLPFFDLYREYADALKEKEAKKAADAFWPFPR
jgi:hypothetical protein